MTVIGKGTTHEISRPSSDVHTPSICICKFPFHTVIETSVASVVIKVSK
jgi:hypothetical protein